MTRHHCAKVEDGARATSIKHRYVSRVSNWPYSSFHRHVASGLLPLDRGGDVAEIAGAFEE
jgi:putative transposase